MKITVFAAGSRGDIQPCLALSIGLQQAGYDVHLAAPENFADFVQRHGVAFYPLRGDVQELMATDTGRAFMETGGSNPIQSVRAIRTMIAPVVMQMAADAYEACRGSDGLICLGVFSAFGQAIAEALDIPLIHIEPTPLLWTRAFPAPSWPIQRNLGRAHNFLSGMLMLQVIWQWYRPFINAFRQQLDLEPTSVVRFYQTLFTTPMLSAYSSALIPHPADWPASLHLTGYFFLEEADWQPAPALQEFLDRDAPPVCIGFGSMSGRNPERFAEIILAALEKSGQRGLILSGWGGLRLENLEAQPAASAHGIAPGQQEVLGQRQRRHRAPSQALFRHKMQAQRAAPAWTEAGGVLTVHADAACRRARTGAASRLDQRVRRALRARVHPLPKWAPVLTWVNGSPIHIL